MPHAVARHARRAVAVLVVVGAIAVALAGQRAPRAAARRASPASSPIEHVVVMIQENHSFDSVLGQWCFETARCNGDDVNQPVQLAHGTTLPLQPAPDIVPDSSHSVASQTVAIDGGKMDGWKNVQQCVAWRGYPCLTYAQETQIPNLLALASTYAISDETFTLKNSPSFGGHLAMGSADLDGFTGDVPIGTAPKLGYGCDSGKRAQWSGADGVLQWVPSCVPDPSLDPVLHPNGGAFEPTPVANVPNIFDRLDSAGISWKIYESVYSWSICPTFASCLYNPASRSKMVSPGTILRDAAAGTLPNYSVLLPTSPIGPSDQHNGKSMSLGDRWIGDVVTALQRGPEWSSTALFILYDDGGLFYDHVAPGTNPDGTPQGIRTPLVVVSPWVKPGYTDSTPTTMAGILHFVENSFAVTPLGVNDSAAYAYDAMFDFTAPSAPPKVHMVQTRVPESSVKYVDATDPDGDENGDGT